MESLVELGLTPAEASVYEAVVKLGTAKAIDISLEANVSYGKIYDMLKSLEKKGLVKVAPYPTKKYVATDPKVLEALVQKKRETLAKIMDDIKILKDKYKIKDYEAVTISHGVKNFYRLLDEIKDPKDTVYKIMYAHNARDREVLEYKRQKKKGVDVKTLIPIRKENIPNIKKWFRLGRSDQREIKNSGVSIAIHDNTQVLLTLINKNQTLLIKDKAFAEVMKDLYLGYYRDAKPIKDIVR